PETTVLFMSGYTHDVIAHRGVLEPGIAFIEKSDISNHLAEKVRQVLSARKDTNRSLEGTPAPPSVPSHPRWILLERPWERKQRWRPRSADGRRWYRTFRPTYRSWWVPISRPQRNTWKNSTRPFVQVWLRRSNGSRTAAAGAVTCSGSRHW